MPVVSNCLFAELFPWEKLYTEGTHLPVVGEGSLEDTIPGVPGDDYPIYATVPDTGFSCDGQVYPSAFNPNHIGETTT